jgi:hypothetical protein
MKTNELFIDDIRYLGDVRTIQWLVEHGAHINYAILVWAIVRNRVDIFKCLVDHGADTTEEVWRCLLRYSRMDMIAYLDSR